MTLRIDRERAAVVVIECQNDLVHESKAAQKGVSGGLARAVRDRGVLPRMKELLAAARTRGVPILYATIENVPGVPKPDCAIYRWSKGQQILRPGTWGAEVHAEVRPEPGDFVVNRHLSIDPSYASALWATLRSLGRTTIVAMGVSTNFAVEGTVRAAVNRMFDVVVVEDCCASVPEEWHRFSVENILPLIATVTKAADVVAALQGGE
ncbi:MAG: cysteine hydrolase family protein [Candidatus Binatia bacterium]